MIPRRSFKGCDSVDFSMNDINMAKERLKTYDLKKCISYSPFANL